MAVRHPLGDRILEALKEALAEGRSDVVEHLLQALEALEGDLRPSSSLEIADLLVAKPWRGSVPRDGRPDH